MFAHRRIILKIDLQDLRHRVWTNVSSEHYIMTNNNSVSLCEMIWSATLSTPEQCCWSECSPWFRERRMFWDYATPSLLSGPSSSRAAEGVKLEETALSVTCFTITFSIALLCYDCWRFLIFIKKLSVDVLDYGCVSKDVPPPPPDWRVDWWNREGSLMSVPLLLPRSAILLEFLNSFSMVEPIKIEIIFSLLSSLM